jgi:hypothetical protein
VYVEYSPEIEDRHFAVDCRKHARKTQ